jgi:hypothetical protein
MRKKVILAIVFGVPMMLVVISIAYWYSGEINGYCGKTKVFASDSGLIESALVLEARQPEFPYAISSPAAAGEYLKNNLGCCKVERWDHPLMTNPFLAVLSGQRGFAVSLVYQRKHPDLDGVYQETTNILNGCGSSIDRYSMSKK